MGNCLRSALQLENPTYPTSHKLHLPDHSDPIEVSLPAPVQTLFTRFQLGQEQFTYSACALPGLFPEINLVKECQDVVDFVREGEEQEDVMFMLLDGHGSEGRAVASQAAFLIRSFFLLNRSLFQVRST